MVKFHYFRLLLRFLTQEAERKKDIENEHRYFWVKKLTKKEKAIFLTARAVKSLRSKMANNICGPFQTNNNEILEIGRDSGVGSRYVLMNFRPKFTLKEEIHVHICFEYFYYKKFKRWKKAVFCILSLIWQKKVFWCFYIHFQRWI